MEDTATTAAPTTDAPAAASPSAPSTLGDAAASLRAVEAPSPSIPDPGTPTVEAGAPAATVPETTSEQAQVPAVTETEPAAAGPIPFAAHKKALENARTKAAQETEAKVRGELTAQTSWAQAIPEQERAQLVGIYQGLTSDPVGTVTALIAQLNQHPQYAQALQSNAARVLASARQQKAPVVDDVEPQPDIPLEDGRALYSDRQQRLRDEWRDRQADKRMADALKPFEQMRQRETQQRQMAELYHGAKTQLDTLRAKPHFADHEPAIKALMVADPGLSVQDAYTQVLIETVIPSLGAQSEQSAIATFQQKAVASSRNPASATTVTPKSTLGDARAALAAADALMGVS